jgi:predicted dehydrogenase
LCLYMSEAKAMAYATRKYKRVLQVGMQFRSNSRFSEAAGIVRSGNLGRIAQTRTWTFTRQQPMSAQPDARVPPSLDHDRWLGPAPDRPFDAVRYAHPERFWDYGGGEATLWSIHMQDLIHAAMRVTVPKSIVAVGNNYGLADERETPDTLDVLFEYASPANSFMQAYSLRLNNAYAGWGPAALPGTGDHVGSLPARSGVQFFGSEKTLFVSGRRLLLLPAGQESPIEDLAFLDIGSRETQDGPADKVDPLTIAHFAEFAECVRSRTQPSASIDAAQWTMVSCIAANIAYRVGRKLYIKPDTLEFYGEPEFKVPDEQATEMLFRPYRDSYPAPSV